MLYQQGLAASFSSFDEAGQLETGVSNNILDEQIPQLPLRCESRFSTCRWGGRSRKLCGRNGKPTDWETCVKQVAGVPSHKRWSYWRPPVQEKHDLYPCWVGHLSASSLRWCTTWPFWFSSCLISWRRMVKSPEWCGRVSLARDPNLKKFSSQAIAANPPSVLRGYGRCLGNCTPRHTGSARPFKI